VITTIYIEESAREHERTKQILARFPKARHVSIERYQDVFNAPAQNFRAQKQEPALVLAIKHGSRVLPTPANYHIGGQHNYYFSHMLNCVYDCRYCFLQGMYRSANYVVFVNFDSFFDDVAETAKQHSEPSWFFSGYDCDSLALNPVTGFVAEALHFFAQTPHANIELRTKSTQIRDLLDREPLSNCIVAYSLSPASVVREEEHRTPSLAKRLDAMSTLQKRGWKIGLRFDPILKAQQFEPLYQNLFDTVFQSLDASLIHSVSLGPFRLPKSFHKKMTRLYPDSPLLAAPLVQRDGLMSYPPSDEDDMLGFCKDQLLQHIKPAQFFPCVSVS